MSDPRKNFACVKCGHVINDKQRTDGKDTECPECVRRDFYTKQGRCPECGGSMVPEGGCAYCPRCGYSPCK
jgi:DNA-directed RNA polymerase subunit RPC12/RpoP